MSSHISKLTFTTIFFMSIIAAFPANAKRVMFTPIQPQKQASVKQDPCANIDVTIAAAKEGKLAAQFNLGRCFNAGNNIEKNQTQAVHWWLKAAEHGHIISQYNLGLCYQKGVGVKVDYKKAHSWFKKASDKGDPFAQLELGRLYLHGALGQVDYKKAFPMFKKAAIQGHHEAQMMLAWAYISGEGVNSNKKEGEKWMRVAASNGNERAIIYFKNTSRPANCFDQRLGRHIDLDDVLLARLKPSKDCLLKHDKMLAVQQVLPDGVLVAMWGMPSASNRNAYIYRRNLRNKDVVDGDVLETGYYRYVGPYSYRSLAGRKTVHSFTRYGK